MKFQYPNLSFGLALLFGCLSCVQTLAQFQQIIQDPFAPPIQAVQDVSPADDKKPAGDQTDENDETEVSDTASTKATETIGDQFVRFHMWDGLIVAGEIEGESITVKTEFGQLQIPIRQIKRFYPGLDSYPALKEKIEGLVAGLGDKDFDVREKSHRTLAGMGLMIRNQLSGFADEGTAEQKKRLAELKKEIDEMLDEVDEDGEEIEKALIDGDTVVTPGFTIVGKIEQGEFMLQTKFGPLNVPLGDIKMADRSFNEVKEEIRKTVDVGAEAFFQRQPVATRIRVNKGDRISIKGDGTVQWTNWSTTSGPDGLANQGQYMGITSGTLCARIGTSGEPIKIGTKGNFVASKSGMLYLAIAIQDNYVNQQGYRWTGGYKAKIQVKPVAN